MALVWEIHLLPIPCRPGTQCSEELKWLPNDCLSSRTPKHYVAILIPPCQRPQDSRGYVALLPPPHSRGPEKARVMLPSYFFPSYFPPKMVGAMQPRDPPLNTATQPPL